MGNVPPSALRQPPPPPGRCLLIEAAPTTSEAEGDGSRARSRPFYSRRCKKGNPSNSIEFESLPDELLIEILVRLSADDICDNVRLVCRRWRHLTHTDAFVHEHLHRTTPGLLIKSLNDRNNPILLTATTQGPVEASKLSCRVRFPILCSCNGLALCLRKDSRSRKIPFILNPATKCAFSLPRLPVGVKELMYRLGIAYAAASMAYKVVVAYRNSMSAAVQCGILTVGVDNSWRHAAVEGLSPEATSFLMKHYCFTPVMTAGFVHWVSETLVVSLNVETEIFTETPTPALMFPPDYQVSNHRYRCLSTGEHLSLLIRCGDWSWEVWEMKPETCEWRKVIPKINLEAHKCKIQLLALQDDDILVRPAGWIRYPELLAFFFNRGRSCIIYNLNTEEFKSIELSFPMATGPRFVGQHRSSLVWSERC